MSADSYVFGNDIGQRVRNFKRAWYTAVLKAHGYTPTCMGNSNLTPASRAALAAIGPHFHDLRQAIFQSVYAAIAVPTTAAP